MGPGLITASFIFIAIFNFNRRKIQSIYHKRKTLMKFVLRSNIRYNKQNRLFRAGRNSYGTSVTITTDHVEMLQKDMYIEETLTSKISSRGKLHRRQF